MLFRSCAPPRTATATDHHHRRRRWRMHPKHTPSPSLRLRHRRTIAVLGHTAPPNTGTPIRPHRTVPSDTGARATVARAPAHGDGYYLRRTFRERTMTVGVEAPYATARQHVRYVDLRTRKTGTGRIRAHGERPPNRAATAGFPAVTEDGTCSCFACLGEVSLS